MIAPQYDEWGRDLALVAAAKSAERELLDEAAALRRQMRALEDRIAEATGGVLPVLPGAEWTRRLALAVAEHFDLSPLELVGRSRVTVVIKPRFALCWLIKQVSPNLAAPRIAMLVGYEDHTSVLHALRRADELRGKDEGFAWSTDQLLIIARRLRAEATPGLALAEAPEPAFAGGGAS